MKSSTTLLKTICPLPLFFLAGCQVDADVQQVDVEEQVEVLVSIPSPAVLDPAFAMPDPPRLITIDAPLNCPFMLRARSYQSSRDGQRHLSFMFVENPTFDSKKDDACEGDLKNIWSELSQFDAEIAAHMPNISGFSNLEEGLRHFPVTARGLKTFIDDAATKASLHETLNSFDRSTLEGGMKIDHAILWLIIENERAYFRQEHSTIIEDVLSKHGLKMKPYEAEKYAYCYHPYDLCRGYDVQRYKKDKTAFKLEHLGSAFNWYGFERPN